VSATAVTITVTIMEGMVTEVTSTQGTTEAEIPEATTQEVAVIGIQAEETEVVTIAACQEVWLIVEQSLSWGYETRSVSQRSNRYQIAL
jgi:hypothetical protein